MPCTGRSSVPLGHLSACGVPRAIALGGWAPLLDWHCRVRPEAPDQTPPASASESGARLCSPLNTQRTDATAPLPFVVLGPRKQGFLSSRQGREPGDAEPVFPRINAGPHQLPLNPLTRLLDLRTKERASWPTVPEGGSGRKNRSKATSFRGRPSPAVNLSAQSAPTLAFHSPLWLRGKMGGERPCQHCYSLKSPVGPLVSWGHHGSSQSKQ